MSSNSDKYITVFVPSYNGGKYTKWCIEGILAQQLPEGYALELLVIDSGSKDGSVEIIKSYGNRLILVEIPNHEFSHGGTRDRAARMAKGEFVVFLSQDATPSHERWLINMIEPFSLSPQIGCVYGRQRPRPDATVTIKREIMSVFDVLGTPDTIVVSRWKSLVDASQENVHNDFFSDVNSAARRDLLVGEVPFRHVAYSEDQALAQDMQEHGYLKAYAPKGEVWHSNEYTWKQYFHRKFDEFTGLQRSTGYKLVASRRSLLFGWIRPTIQDWKFIRRDGEYSLRSKIVWAIESPLYNIAAKAGLYVAAKHMNDRARHKRLSLEERRKEKD